MVGTKGLSLPILAILPVLPVLPALSILAILPVLPVLSVLPVLPVLPALSILAILPVLSALIACPYSLEGFCEIIVRHCLQAPDPFLHGALRSEENDGSICGFYAFQQGVTVHYKNVALYRERLYEKVWREPFLGETRTLDSHIQRLRKKLGWEDRIKKVAVSIADWTVNLSY